MGLHHMIIQNTMNKLLDKVGYLQYNMPKKVEPKQDYAPRVYTWQLDQIPTDNEIHDKLMYAFQQYYKANLHWGQAGTKRSGQDARYWLSEINKLTTEQRKFVLEWIKTISDKTNKERTYKSTTKKQRKLLQIQGSVGSHKDN